MHVAAACILVQHRDTVWHHNHCDKGLALPAATNRCLPVLSPYCCEKQLLIVSGSAMKSVETSATSVWDDACKLQPRAKLHAR